MDCSYMKMPEVSGWWWDEEAKHYTCIHSSGGEPGCPGCLDGSLHRARKALDEGTKELESEKKWIDFYIEALENEKKWSDFYFRQYEKLQKDLDKAKERIVKLEDAFLPLAITHPHLVPEEFQVVAIQYEKIREIFGEDRQSLSTDIELRSMEVEDDEEQIPTVGT